MQGTDAARLYLARNETYVDALKAVLKDLEIARNAGHRSEEERLCMALTALRDIGNVK